MMRSSMLTRGRTLSRLALSTPGFAGGDAVARSIPLGLMLGGPFSPFSRVISSRCAATVCLRAATSASNCATSSLSCAGLSASRASGGGTPTLNRKAAAKRTGKPQPSQSLLTPVALSTHFSPSPPHPPGVLPVLPSRHRRVIVVHESDRYRREADWSSGRSLSDPDACLALQAEPGPPPSYPSATA